MHCLRGSPISLGLIRHNGSYIAAISQVINEVASDADMPMSEEQSDSVDQLIALHFNADDGTHYAQAGQWFDAAREFLEILTQIEIGEYTEIGYSPANSVSFISSEYGAASKGIENYAVADYIDNLIGGLGG